MRLLRPAAWILLGVGLGTGLQALLFQLAEWPRAADVMSLASMAVVAMMTASLQAPWRPQGAHR